VCKHIPGSSDSVAAIHTHTHGKLRQYTYHHTHANVLGSEITATGLCNALPASANAHMRAQKHTHTDWNGEVNEDLSTMQLASQLMKATLLVNY